MEQALVDRSPRDRGRAGRTWTFQRRRSSDGFRIRAGRRMRTGRVRWFPISSRRPSRGGLLCKLGKA